jgi:transaldolase
MMNDEHYLSWLSKSGRSRWWHDSADPGELARGLERGASGATTNPFLARVALAANRGRWAQQIREALAAAANAEDRAEQLMRIPVTEAARSLLPQFQGTEGRQGWVCAQVNPARAADREGMLAMARRFHAWAPNVTVKLPATSAGLDVLEECVAEGVSVTLTVSFTVPQVLAVAERRRQGRERANARQLAPGSCFAVLMIGRLDDYLREVALDSRAEVTEEDIRQAGLAVAKRAYSLLEARGDDLEIIVAAVRGPYHVTELAGAKMIFSIFPSWQEPLMSGPLPRQERIRQEIPPAVIRRLSRVREFVRAYEPDGMKPEEFIGFGPTQRTLAQFYDAGWKSMEGFAPELE